MWRSPADTFEKLRGFLDTVPVIETHEHYAAVCEEPEDLDVLEFFVSRHYYPSDLISCANDFRDKAGTQRQVPDTLAPVHAYIADRTVPFEKRYDVWHRYYQRSFNTAYAKAFEEGLKACWGLKDFSKESLLDLQHRMRDERKQEFADKMYADHRIKAMIVDSNRVPLEKYLTGEARYNRSICRFVVGLPPFHLDINTKEALSRFNKYLGRRTHSLEDYLEGFELYFKKCLDFGIVGMKDQSAYRRKIAYRNAPRAAAEKVFSEIISHPRMVYGTREVRELDDFLLHYFLKIAAKYSVPVQIHTGHMAKIRNEITKTNPAHLTGVLELHEEVEFDLFHGGWPFMGEFLFLGKNYPNVSLDMCWVHAIDPVYSVELLKRALMTIPYTKIMGFGGDTGKVEWTIGYLLLAKDNIAIALSSMIDHGWIDLEEAQRIAAAWLYDNPNRLFKLGLPSFS